MLSTPALILAAALAGPPAAEVPAAVPFVSDDYGRALAEARQRRLPMFVEAWAPW